MASGTARSSPAGTMGRGGGGSVLNIRSTLAHQGGPDTVHSASAKAGVLSMAKSLAAAWRQHGIRVNALIPGMTEGTGGVQALHRTEADSPKRIPLGRMVTKHELAHAASYVVSDFAGYVTGAELVVDGGRSLGSL